MDYFHAVGARLRWGSLVVPAALLAGNGAVQAPNVGFAARGRKISLEREKSADDSESNQRITGFAVRTAGSVAGKSLGETT